ncbi:MAG: hypothetical protein JKY48_03295, partial [Flavobacteriales bacterium]|nr:hypothetical protein [Flavobacteriales bacterium]
LESRLNQSEFEYFKRTGYCDACKQSADITKGTFEYMDSLANSSLPEWARQGAVEIKASWKILVEGKDINSRYYTTKGYFLSPSNETLGPYTFGLTGLHILRNTPRSSKTWYWTTFEQVDNVEIYDKNPPKRPDGKELIPSFNPGPAGAEPHYQYGYDIVGRFDVRNRFDLSDSIRGNPVIEPQRLDSGDIFPQPNRRPVNCSRVTSIPEDVKKINKEFQARLAGTPWEYYEMVNAIYPDPDPNTGIFELLKPNGEHHEPDRIFSSTPALINITMEAYLTFKPAQWSVDNCLSCHYDAEPRSFGNNLGKSDAKQTFSYLYRRALPKYPETVDRTVIDKVIKIINGKKFIEYDTTIIQASKFNCDSIKYMNENYH